MEPLLLKVCGMREPGNIQGLISSSPDFIGLIFYQKSARYVRSTENKEVIHSIPEHIKKVGVFVNEPIENLIKIVSEYNLQYVQLHGGESVDYCLDIKDQGIKIIKVFSVQDHLDMELLSNFEGIADYFLFDTKTTGYGGSGRTFDWNILKGYESRTPYFLSGGIGLDELEMIRRDNFPKLAGIDINSKVEDRPGFKNLDKIEKFKNTITKYS